MAVTGVTKGYFTGVTNRMGEIDGTAVTDGETVTDGLLLRIVRVLIIVLIIFVLKM